MYRTKGKGRACIEHNHLRNVLGGGTRPARFNPHFEVPEQRPPTSDDPVRQRYKFGTSGMNRSSEPK